MPRYHFKKPPPHAIVRVKEVIGFPSLELEEDNDKYFQNLIDSNFFSVAEVSILREVKCRDQFEAYCMEKGYGFQQEMFGTPRD